LLKAARAERAQLARQRGELVAARERLRAELVRIEAALQAVDERQALLDRLIGPASEAAANGAGDAVDHLRDADAVLRGPAIRREAVRVLLAHPDRPEALHYREWFELLSKTGFRVAGRDPLATFLTQLSRSPVVRKSTQAGVYELDRAAAACLRRRVDELYDELRAVTAAATQGAVAAVRARRSQVNAELSRAEKALEEAELLFGHHPSEEAGPLGDAPSAR
jgi:hypothetical protein